MIFVGIDVAKEKHDCFITNSDGEILFDVFTISNNIDGFSELLMKIKSLTKDLSNVKVGLEATGHYSYNINNFLINNRFVTYVINPLHTNLYRKSLSLRLTKTDRVDARTITMMLMSELDLKPYSEARCYNEELKSLTRYRFDKVYERARLKTSVARLINILFPEIETIVHTIHMKSVYALLSEFPSASLIASAHLTRLTHLLSEASKGRYGKETALKFRAVAKSSIGSGVPAKSLELKHTISLIQELTKEINEIESEIKKIMDRIDSPVLSIPGISYATGAMIIAEIGDINDFSSHDKLLAYSGLSPTTYQSGHINSAYSHMEKRGSRYLRYALFNATKYVCKWEPTFAVYLAKKRAEGKHYNVAISHAAKKLVRLIYHLEKTGERYTHIKSSD